MPSIFTRIIEGEIPSYKIYEDDLIYVFLDINPVATGHTLVVPKQEIAHFLDLDDDTYSHLMLMAKNVIGPAVQKATGCDRIGTMIEWYGVQDHFHYHIVPINGAGELSFEHAHQEEQSVMKDIQEKIIQEL